MCSLHVHVFVFNTDRELVKVRTKYCMAVQCPAFRALLYDTAYDHILIQLMITFFTIIIAWKKV